MRTVACLGLLAATVSAQGLAAGFTELSFTNTSGAGTPTIPATVYYPATSAGRNAPLLPRPGGYAVVVFLHGLNVLGSGYGAFGAVLAEHGYVAVLGNTAQSSATTQIDDAIALFPALLRASGQPGHFLQGALDMTRAGVSGHSMGGSTTPSVLAAPVNPGYRAGFSFSPGIAPAAAQVQVPMAVCHGTGDQLLNWQTFGLALYQNLTNVTQLRLLYVLNQDCDHANIAGYIQLTQVDREVFAATSRVALGFFDCFLCGDTAGIEGAMGPGARAEPRLYRLDSEVRAPALWSVGTPRPAGNVRFTVTGEPGPTALLCAAAQGSLPTPFGTLRLDPATLVFLAAGAAGGDDLWNLTLAIPGDPGLIGARVPFQGLALDAAAALRFTGAWPVAIVP